MDIVLLFSAFTLGVLTRLIVNCWVVLCFSGVTTSDHSRKVLAFEIPDLLPKEGQHLCVVPQQQAGQGKYSQSQPGCWWTQRHVPRLRCNVRMVGFLGPSFVLIGYASAYFSLAMVHAPMVVFSILRISSRAFKSPGARTMCNQK